MKYFNVGLFAIFLMLTSCGNKDVVLTGAEIPAPINDFVGTHFSGSTINKVVQDKDFNELTYEIILDNSTELDFNSNFEITSIEGDSKLPDSLVPQEILSYVAQNYTHNYINGWELDDNKQQVELDNGTDLEFDMNGNFVKVD